MLLAGWPGSGKTTALLSIPKCLLIDAEGGSNYLPMVHPSSARVSVSSYEDALEILKGLEADAPNESRRAFDTVAIDTMDAFGGSQVSIFCEYVVRESGTNFISQFGSNGAGWGRLHELFAHYTHRIRAAGYGLVATCHLRKKQYNDQFGNQRMGIVRDMTARIDGIVANAANFIGEIAKTVKVIPKIGKVNIGGKVIEREIGTEQVIQHEVSWRSPDPERDALLKTRLPIPSAFTFTPEDFWSQFVAHYDAAVAKVREQQRSRSNES